MIIIICMSLKKKQVVKQASSLGKGFVVVFLLTHCNFKYVVLHAKYLSIFVHCVKIYDYNYLYELKKKNRL